MSTKDVLFTAVKNVEPVVRQYAAAADRERRLPAPVADAMLQSGLYGLWRPEALGGFEAPPRDVFEVLEELARIDSAAAWNLMLSISFDMFGAWYDDETARELFTPDTILAGAFNPMRRAVPVDGGYVVSGRTPFVSGVNQATLIFGLAAIFAGDAPRAGPDGNPEVLLTACPAGKAEIIENWNTMGMCGTGSHDLEMTDVFIPEKHAIRWAPLTTPGSAYGGPLYRLTVWPSIAAISVPALGIARAAVEEAIELVTGKTPAYTTKTLRDRTAVHILIAQATAKIDSARAYLYRVIDDVWEEAVAGKPFTTEMKAKMQLAATNAACESARAVDLIHEIVGSSGIREEYAFVRHFRDVHVITQHGFINASKMESVGQVLLGLEPEWPFFSF